LTGKEMSVMLSRLEGTVEGLGDGVFAGPAAHDWVGDDSANDGPIDTISPPRRLV
jgi:hypothetical protein